MDKSLKALMFEGFSALQFYHLHYKELILELSISLASLWKNSWIIFLKLQFVGKLSCHPPFKDFLMNMGFKVDGREP